MLVILQLIGYAQATVMMLGLFGIAIAIHTILSTQTPMQVISVGIQQSPVALRDAE